MVQRFLILSLLMTQTFAPIARADEVVLAGADGRSVGQRMPDVTVLRIDGENLIYRTAGGTESSRPVSRVLRIAVTSDPSFTAAEEAYAAGNGAAAIDPYLKAVRTNDAWKIRRAAPRLIEAAVVAKRFDSAVTGYIAYAKIDPAAAAGSKPALPPRGSALLEDAAKQLEAALRGAANDRERQALLSLSLDVQMTRGDQKAAEAIAEQLLKLSSAAGDDPKLAALTADVRLGQARLAIQSKRFAEVAKTIDEIGPRLTEPRQQAEAFYLLAESKLGLAPASDKPARLEAATAFMRVVAHFNETEAGPFVSNAMLRAAEVLADAGDAAGARALCGQIAAEVPNTPAAIGAAALLKRLDAAATTN